MAMACLRLVTFLPLRPLLSVPFFLRRIALATVLLAPLLYFLAMSGSPVLAVHCTRAADPSSADAGCPDAGCPRTTVVIRAGRGRHCWSWGPRYGPPDPPIG